MSPSPAGRLISFYRLKQGAHLSVRSERDINQVFWLYSIADRLLSDQKTNSLVHQIKLNSDIVFPYMLQVHMRSSFYFNVTMWKLQCIYTSCALQCGHVHCDVQRQSKSKLLLRFLFFQIKLAKLMMQICGSLNHYIQLGCEELSSEAALEEFKLYMSQAIEIFTKVCNDFFWYIWIFLPLTGFCLVWINA